MTVAPPTDRSAAVPGGPVSRRSDRAQSLGPPLALLVLVLAFAALSPQFRTLGNLQSILDAAAVLAVVTVGVTFVLLMGGIDLSVAGVMGAGALTVSLLVANNRTEHDLGLLGVLAAVALGGLFGLLSGALSVGLRIPSFMTTLGVSAIGIGVATALFAGVQPSITDERMVAAASQRVFGLTQVTYLALACVALAWVIQRFTRLGRYVMAIGGGEDILALSGIPVGFYKIAAFTLAGCCYGLAAVMVSAQLGSGIVDAGGAVNFAAIAAAVVGGTQLSGGRGGVLPSMVGVLILTVLANGLVLVGVSPYVQSGVQGVIVIVAVGAALWPMRHRLGVVK